MSNTVGGPNVAAASEPVPFLDLNGMHAPITSELVAAFENALRSSQFVGGAEVEGFEREFARYVDGDWCLGVNSGTDALRFAYLTLGVPPGREVVTVAHTFIATTEALTQAGARIRFVDIDDETMTIDTAQAAAALGPNTAGLVPVHLYGLPADLDPLLVAARKVGVWVVEDAAQAHGARYHGKRVGALADLGCFSFYPGKNLGSLGEGGAVTGGRATARDTIRQLREHGQSSKYVHEGEGFNGRLHAIQAAFLRIKLRHLEGWNEARRRVAGWYREALSGVGDLRLPIEPTGREHVYHLYVVRSNARDALRARLSERGIGVGLHYPTPLHLQRAYDHLGMRVGSLPVTERAATTGLSLPMFPSMSESQVDRVADTIRQFFGS